MKKLYKLSLLLFIPFLLGLALNIIGGQTDNGQMARIGQMILSIGMPVSMVLMVVIGLVLTITGRLSDNNKKNDEQTSEREKEYTEIAEANSARRYESHLRQGEYVSRHLADNYKNSTLTEKILGWLFFGFLIGDFLLIFLFTYLRNFVGIIVCFSIFAGTILIALITKIMLERRSMRAKYNKYHGDVLQDGEVKACLLSSMSSVGGSERRHTTRITGVTYRVIIVADDREYTAYTHNFYETGEHVKFFARGKRSATIVDDEETDQ